jgi:CubicO group peptidase (beta-lactamase class C family)
MILRHRAGCLLIAATLGATPAHAQGNPKADEFDRYVTRALGQWKTTGLAIAVVKDGRIVFAKGYGVREIGRPAPVDTSTLFAVASTTKAMTAAAIGILVDEGKVRWDDPVTKHIPRFRLQDPWVTREITVRDLLTHRAGLDNADYLWYVSDFPIDTIVDRVAMLKPAYSMRSSFIYQNVMYIVAGEVVSAASGMPWAEFVRRRIFEPIGMRNTYAVASLVPSGSNAATPHFRYGGDTIAVARRDRSQVLGPAGDVWSNVADMSRWARFLLDSGRVDGKALLEPATWAELFTPQTMVPPDEFYPSQQLTRPAWRTYGLGWFQHDYRGRKLDFHTGSLAGMVAIMGLVHEEKFGVFISANVDHAEIRHALMYKAIDTWVAGPGRDWSTDLLAIYDRQRVRRDSVRAANEASRITNTRPSLELSKYAGTYRDPVAGRVHVQVVNGRLRFEASPALRGLLEHWHYDRFRVRYDDRWQGTDPVSFTIGNGTPTALEFAGYTFRRVPDPQASATQ